MNRAITVTLRSLWPFGDMEPVPGLDDADIERIVAYVRENQRIHGFEPYPP